MRDELEILEELEQRREEQEEQERERELAAEARSEAHKARTNGYPRRRSNKQKLKDGFYSFMATGDETLLLERTREHLVRRFYPFSKELEWSGADGNYLDAEDEIQETLTKIWMLFATFEGDSTDYEKWINVICSNSLLKAGAKLKKARKEFVPFSVERGEDNKHGTGLDPEGDLEVIQNPAVTKALYPELHGRPANWFWRPAFIPNEIQRVDREICEQILYTDRTYAEIAELFPDMTETDIKNTTRRLKREFEDVFAAEKEAKAARLKAKDDAYNEQIAKRLAYYDYRRK
jgi:hypothetical protein